MPRRLLRSLHLVGLDFLDPVVLAALADERPLLLIGPHGTAKSELLNRLAACLGLAHRHYNASLISFDDLLGYPVPEPAADAVRYLRTPGDLWDAESVFLDEISRCRPETQNKLFSVVHEKRVQGMALPRLRYRWAAMNPPLTPDSDPDEAYEGSLPLDPALADRFAYVVELPTLLDLAPKDRLALIRDGGAPPAEPPALPALVAQVRERLAAMAAADHDWAARYVSELVGPLAEARLPISGRRAVLLAGMVVAVQAAARTLGRAEGLADCGLIALRSGLPQRAQGRVIEAAKVAAIHRHAVQLAGEPEDGPWRRVNALADPVARVAEALRWAGRGIDRLELSNLVTEAFAGLTVPQQYLFARHVLPRAAALECLNVPAYELLAAPMARLVDLCTVGEHSVALPRTRMPEWSALSKRVTELSRGTKADPQLANVLLTLFAVERQSFDPDVLVALDARWQALFADVADAQPEAA
jgi:MoxR-like ATPase